MSGFILVVEDEQDLATTIEYNLAQEGYRSKVAGNGGEALEIVNSAPLPDLILLDLMLPDMSGTDICRQLRAASHTRDIPVIMVTAKGEEIDRVVGFEVGADDYMVKPFSVRELMLRVRALLRRASGTTKKTNVLESSDLRLDKLAHKVWVGEEEIRLTPLEFKLLALLMERRGRVQSRERLLADIWGIQQGVTTRTVDTHVKRLREKLGEASQHIQTLRGVGYRFEESEARAAAS